MCSLRLKGQKIHMKSMYMPLHFLSYSGQKEALKGSSQEIEVLQESISSVNTKLLPSTNHGMCHSHTL